MEHNLAELLVVEREHAGRLCVELHLDGRQRVGGGEVSLRVPPAGQVRSGQVRSDQLHGRQRVGGGEVSLRVPPAGQVRSGQVRSGQAGSGWVVVKSPCVSHQRVKSGQVRSGQVSGSGQLHGRQRVGGGEVSLRVPPARSGAWSHLRVPPGQVRSGQVRPGQARSGQVRSGHGSHLGGQVRSGQVRPGQIRSGQVRSVRSKQPGQIGQVTGQRTNRW